MIPTLPGMFVKGFVVRAANTIDGTISYGLFSTAESALAWQEQMNIPTVIEPVYAPVYNRG